MIGPSGSGKSTLLRTINMLEEPTEGKVFFDGTELTHIRTDLNEARTHMGMVFQQFNLFPHLTAIEQHHPGAHQGARTVPRRRRPSGPWSNSTTSGSPTRPTPTRRNSPAASSSGSPSPGRWRCSPS